MLAQKNSEIDRNLKVEEIVDTKNERILELEKEVLRLVDEVNCRKEMIDAMSASLMGHEKESQQMAQTLVLMKNQIIENDAGAGVSRKFAAIKIGTLKKMPCVVSYNNDN